MGRDFLVIIVGCIFGVFTGFYFFNFFNYIGRWGFRVSFYY